VNKAQSVAISYSPVLIVIPAFNAGRYIKQTLLSILNSSFRDFVVVVVNDGSSDDTENEVRSVNDNRIVLVSRCNSGMSSSRNYGIELINSEFIALCDADDIWHPQKLELQIGLLSADCNVGLCYTEFVKYFDGGDTQDFLESKVVLEIDENLSGHIYHKMLLTNWALPSSVVFRRSLWDKLGPFLCDDQQTDDWEYFVRASLQFSFAKLKSPLVLYRQPSSSLSRRVPKYNVTELMRQSFIDKYGLVSPQGNNCDADQLAFRRYISNKGFFDIQLSRGGFFLGFFGLIHLLIFKKNKFSTLVTLVKSIKCRLVG
jgi:glycosyltransferase involved in cell wall biosynthesis